MTNTLQRLHAEHDQSPWIDFIDRDLIAAASWPRWWTRASGA